jgi:CDP-glucose 4,6-dehydratase
MGLNQDFWNGKKVFVTGHTGFKGSWLLLLLDYLGAQISGYALEPNTDPNFFSLIKKKINIHSNIGDIRDYDHLSSIIKLFKPEIVIHMAAQPLVRLSYDDPINTYSTNVIGTVNILEILKNTESVKSVLNVTSDKCYENREQQKGYVESDRLGGFDPYSNSKACSELVTQSYLNSFYTDKNIGLSSARAGNVIGGGDWSEDRLIPDFIRAVFNNTPLEIRKPNAVRPWQHVIEPLAGYLVLCEKLYENPNKFSSSWNFGPNDSDLVSVESIIKEMISLLNRSDFNFSLNQFVGNKHETNILKLNSSKSQKHLNWQLKWNYKKALIETINWYKTFYNGEDIVEFSQKQIKKYLKDHSS